MDESRLDDWLAHGLITAEQAASIRAHEMSREASTPRRLPLAAEAIGYLGGSLAMIAVGIIVGQYWANLETWARLVLIGFASLLLLAAGAAVMRSEEPALRRLTSFLWLLSAAGAAFFAGVVADGPLGAEPKSTALTAGIALLVYAGALWLARRTALQLIAVAAGSIVTVVALVMQPTPAPAEWAGLAVWGLGLVWLMNAWGGLLRPAAVAVAAGCVMVLAGSQAFGLESMRGWGLFLGLATSLGLMGASALVRSQLLLGFGALGLFVFVPQAVFHWFADTLGAPVALLVVGLALLGASLSIGRLRDRVREPVLSS